MEIAAAGAHNLLMIGCRALKLFAARLPGLLPPLTPKEALDVTMLHSVAGQLPEADWRSRPTGPHHSASMPALVGGACARPGEISLAHGGVLFLDELAEFAKPVLDALRQPLETGQVVIARANHHVTYPARFQLVAAMNPCRCGYLGDPARSLQAPARGRTQSARISGPMLDRFDLIVEVPEVDGKLLLKGAPGEIPQQVMSRVMWARHFAAQRVTAQPDLAVQDADGRTGPQQDVPVSQMEEDARALLNRRLTASHYRQGFQSGSVARTIADLDASPKVARRHLAEALAYRAIPLLA